MDSDDEMEDEKANAVMKKVEHVLRDHAHLIYTTFDYHAAMNWFGSTTSDIFHIDFNAFCLFIESCRLSSAALTPPPPPAAPSPCAGGGCSPGVGALAAPRRRRCPPTRAEESS